MKEDFLHYIWKTRKFDHTDLKTNNGQSISIIYPGEHNHDAGPDFSNAKIQIGNILWAGNVEIHLKASDWYKHRHDTDTAYDSVILHVVLEDDQEIKLKNGSQLLSLSLKKRLSPKLISKYLRLQQNDHWIACQHQLHEVKSITKNLWLDRLLVERLESKTQDISQRLQLNHNNWEEAFYQSLARGFGQKVNALPFEELAKSIPLRLLTKYKSNLFQLEALLFGQAGMLSSDFKDDYPSRLQREYRFLLQKHKLNQSKGNNWKFLRMRPANFPSVRIAQFAMLVHQSNHLFSKVMAAKNIREIENMFELKIASYWQMHYRFDTPSVRRTKSFGKASIHLLIINTIVPFMFYYGKYKSEPTIKEKALQLLESLKPEKNKIIRKWSDLGIEPASAYQSQALLQLKANYCTTKRCMECRIGCSILG